MGEQEKKGQITIIAKNIKGKANGQILEESKKTRNTVNGKFYQGGKKGGVSNNKNRNRKLPLELRVLKVEGPFDSQTNKKVNAIEKEKRYNFKVTQYNRTATKEEIKNLKWGFQYDDGNIAFAPQIMGKESISDLVPNKDQVSKLRVYAFFKAPNKNASVEVGLKNLKFPILIIQGKHRKGKNDENTGTALDMLYNDYPENNVGIERLKNEIYTEEYNSSIKAGDKDWLKTKEETASLKAKNLSEVRITKIKGFLKKDNDKLFSIFRDDMWYYASREVKNVAYDMVDKVKANNGGEYSNIKLTNAVIAHEKSKEFISGVEKVVKNYIINNKGIVDKLEIKDDSNGILYKALQDNDVQRPIFHDNMSGLGITINDVWAYQIYISSYKVNGNKYEISLEVIYWDHFGLDYPDVHKFDNDIFQAWFILQHFRGFKPLITKLDIKHSFKGSF